MPWIEEEIEHQYLLDEFWWKILRRFQDTDGNYWWQDFNKDVEKVDLYKIAYNEGLFVIRDGEFVRWKWATMYNKTRYNEKVGRRVFRFSAINRSG